MFGKTRRLNRLFVGEEKLCLLSPLDHGGWLGPVKGLDNPEWIVGEVLAGGANAVLASPGFLKVAEKSLKPETGLVLRVSLTAGLSKQGTQETPIATIDSAIRMNADAVAVSVFFGREGDIEIYQWLAALIEECRPYDIPVIAEMMPPENVAYDPTAIAHAARIGMEIGADVIKTNFSGSAESFRQVVKSVSIPIIVAGGPKSGNEGDDATALMAKAAIEAGAKGVAIGRRVWQSQNPKDVTRQVAAVFWK
jgi:fructose-bisphosphate aldolase/2-amino-3,7-dideoxy-D-threo-hept-6-ulosonate synthase